MLATPMTLMKRAAALVLSTILSGCVVGPDYIPPKTGLTAFHNFDAVKSRLTTTPAPQLDHWWTGFNDPLLVQSAGGYRDRLGYAQLALHMRRVAAGLAALGVRRGDRVGVYLCQSMMSEVFHD